MIDDQMDRQLGGDLCGKQGGRYLLGGKVGGEKGGPYWVFTC